MQEIVTIYKPLGWTPLQALERFKEKNKPYRDLPMTYAGRLDPMAEGVLLTLAGDKVHEKDFYLKLDKQYEAEILIGIETDTYDVLGKIIRTSEKMPTTGLLREVRRFNGANILQVPPYSSYVVNSKPLFYWAREGKLEELQIPKRTMTVHDIDVGEISEMTAAEVLAMAYKKINLVSGDFRQEEIKKSWDETFDSISTPFTVINVKFHVASGVYIRSIAHELGERIGCGAILLNLKRTAVGEFTEKDAVKVA